ncbi:MAG: uracil-DNA glycosylase, partial [Bacilli bacterium]
MTWDELFLSIKDKEYCKKLNSFLDSEYANKTIYPPRKDMFNAFKYTPLNIVKVVIIGQDPYPNPNQAMGIA